MFKALDAAGRPDWVLAMRLKHHSGLRWGEDDCWLADVAPREVRGGSEPCSGPNPVPSPEPSLNASSTACRELHVQRGAAPVASWPRAATRTPASHCRRAPPPGTAPSTSVPATSMGDSRGISVIRRR